MYIHTEKVCVSKLLPLFISRLNDVLWFDLLTVTKYR